LEESWCDNCRKNREGGARESRAQNGGVASAGAKLRRWSEERSGNDGWGWWQRRWQRETKEWRDGDGRCSTKRVHVRVRLRVVAVAEVAEGGWRL